jgi:phospholipid/cholesterol/gamma-HCH transport system substrate-binding protein
MTTFTAGLLGIIAVIVITYLGFTKFANPFSNPYTVKAVFANANGVRPDSLVRIAGINVGKVASVAPETSCKGQHPCDAAVVTMTIDDNGLPIHKDATFAIRPRIFLEGNFFIDIHPGTPEAPTAPSNFTFPIQNGVEPVQLDQVLTSLQADTRHNLQILLEQYGTAVKQSGPSYNASVRYWLPAYKYSSIVSHDALGLQPHDLSNWIAQNGTVSAALDSSPSNIKNLVSDLNTTAHALAIQQANLQRTVAELPGTLAAATPAFNALNSIICAGPQVPACAPGALPKLAKALIPGVKSTGPMVDASLPFISQLRQLVQPSELQGLAKDLTVTIPALAKLTVTTIPFMRDQVRPASSCEANVVYPWSQLTVPDSHFNASNGFPSRKVYIEAVDYLPGLAGESRNFDSNGPYIRVGMSAGAALTYTLANGFFGQAAAPLEGFQPTLPPTKLRPPIAGGDAPNAPCETQPAITDLTAPSSASPNPIITPATTGGLPLPPLPFPIGLSKNKNKSSANKSSASKSSANKSPASKSSTNKASTSQASARQASAKQASASQAKHA